MTIKEFIKWKVRVLILKLPIKWIYRLKLINPACPDYDPCGGFDIWHGTCCKSGHMWCSMSDSANKRGEFTEKKITETLLKMFNDANRI